MEWSAIFHYKEVKKVKKVKIHLTFNSKKWNLARKICFITDGEIQVMFNIKQTRAYVITKTMREKGILVTEDRGSTKKYYLK